MENNKSKQKEYTVKILNHLQQLFNEKYENHISLLDFNDANNSSDFFHCLATLVPAVLYNKLTGNNVNSLEFNHIANILCFKNSNIAKDEL